MTWQINSLPQTESYGQDRVGQIMQEIEFDPNVRYPNPLAAVALHGASIVRRGYDVIDLIEFGQACSEDLPASRPAAFSHLRSLATEIYMNTQIEDEPFPGLELTDE
jgi:hypothetical protein